MQCLHLVANANKHRKIDALDACAHTRAQSARWQLLLAQSSRCCESALQIRLRAPTREVPVKLALWLAGQFLEERIIG